MDTELFLKDSIFCLDRDANWCTEHDNSSCVDLLSGGLSAPEVGSSDLLAHVEAVQLFFDFDQPEDLCIL